MNTCETYQNGITDSLVENRDIDPTIEQHLRSCDHCTREYALALRLWEILPRLGTSLRDEKERSGTVLWFRRHSKTLVAALVAATLFGSGLMIGSFASRDGATNRAANTNVAALEEKVDSLNDLVALSLLEQSSASARLEAISRISEMEQPSTGAVTGLLRAAVTDPNPNVRLAAVEAARPHLNRPGVYDELSERLAIESSPLVQIALVDLLLDDPTAGPEDLRQLMDRDDVADEVRTFVRERTGASI